MEANPIFYDEYWRKGVCAWGGVIPIDPGTYCVLIITQIDFSGQIRAMAQPC